MGWLTTADDAPLLWSMEEADITADTDTHRIGYAQVGLDIGPLDPSLLPPSLRSLPSRKPMAAPSMELPERGGWYGYPPLPFRRKRTDPVMALPALTQCFHDSLARFGDVHLSALQLTIFNPDLSKDSRWIYLVSSLNWFNTNLTEGADAIVSFDQGLLGGDDVSKLVASLNWRNTGSFDFSAVERAPERCIIKLDVDNWFHQRLAPASSQGLLVSMPEWTPSAAGYVLATVIDAARGFTQDTEALAVRITRN